MDRGVDIQLPEGASASGLSYWTALAQCPRRARLAALGDGGGRPGAGQARGILVHAMLEHWLQDKVSAADLVEAPFYPEDHPALADLASVADARRLGPWLVKSVFGLERRGLGDIVAIEHAISSGPELARRLGVPLIPDGPTELTARLDLLLDIGEAHIPRWASIADGGKFVFPGRWVVDLKVLSARSNLAGYAAHMASLWYPLAAEKEFGTPVAGIIYLCLIATRQPGIEVVVTPTDLNAVDILRAFFQSVERKLAGGLDATDPSACVDFFRTCPYLRAGCSRF